MKVIHIMDHPTPYEVFRDMPRPVINKDTKDGDWVGIWGDDWSDKLSTEVLKISDEFDHEVWQPELKIENIFSHQFESGLVHRLFPARKVLEGLPFNRMDQIISRSMVDYLLGMPEFPNDCVIHLGQSIFDGLYKYLLARTPLAKFIMSFHGEIMTPRDYLFRHQKNYLKKIKYFKEHINAKQVYSRFSHITYQCNKNLGSLRSYYNGPITKITMGIDFNQFQPHDKLMIRGKLSIDRNKKVLISVGLISKRKQIDKLIEVLRSVDKDFLLIIVGDGEPQYLMDLHEKARDLIDSDKIRFVGYQDNSGLSSYFSAADLFVHASKSEAGPVVTMEAIACGLPVLTTNTGNVAELLLKENVGKVVGISDYSSWKTEIEAFLDGSEIQVMDREVAKQHYDWKNVAQKFLNIYREVAYHS